MCKIDEEMNGMMSTDILDDLRNKSVEFHAKDMGDFFIQYDDNQKHTLKIERESLASNPIELLNLSA